MVLWFYGVAGSPISRFFVACQVGPVCVGGRLTHALEHPDDIAFTCRAKSYEDFGPTQSKLRAVSASKINV